LSHHRPDLTTPTEWGAAERQCQRLIIKIDMQHQRRQPLANQGKLLQRRVPPIIMNVFRVYTYVCLSIFL